MTLTENYGLKKPDLTDMQDVGVLNENFDTIDTELKSRIKTINSTAPDENGDVNVKTGGYYDINLTEQVSVSLAEDADQTVDVSQYVDIEALQTAINADKTIRLLTSTADSTIESYGGVVYISLTDKIAAETVEMFVMSGITPVSGGGIYRAVLSVIPSSSNVSLTWKAIQGEKYYELDLRETVSLELLNDNSLTWAALTDEDTDLTALWDAAKAGEPIQVHFAFTNDSGTYEVSVPVTNRNEDTDKYIGYGGNVYGAVFGDRVYSVVLSFTVSENIIILSVTDMRAYYRSVFVSQEIPTNTTVVKSDSTVTITTTLEGDKQSVTTITVDENDYPTSINTDGTEWPVTWEGF